MSIRTLQEAWQLGWRVRVKCDTRGEHWRAAHRDRAVSCHSTHELDMKALVWTRGALPINELKDRLKCPACESRHVLVFFEVPNEPASVAAEGKIDIEDYREEG